MNLKALITTLVLGTSSAAMADSITLSGSVKVSLGGSAPARPAPPVVVHHQPVADDCNDNRPSPHYQTPVHHAPVVVSHPAPSTPTIRGPYYNPTNVKVGNNSSSYIGWVAKAPMTRYYAYGKSMWRPSATTWFDLTEATRIDAGREFFTIGADKGRFKAIKLQALGAGRSIINQVAIEFLDATGRAKTQVVKFNTSIDVRSNPVLSIDLEGNYRSINRIVVYGSTDRGSAFKLLAM